MVGDHAVGNWVVSTSSQRPLVRRLGEDASAAPEDDREDHQPVLVDEVRSIRLREGVAPRDEEAALSCFSSPPPRHVALEHLVFSHSGSLSVVDATYFGIAFILSANSPPRFGQAPAKPS